MNRKLLPCLLLFVLCFISIYVRSESLNCVNEFDTLLRKKKSFTFLNTSSCKVLIPNYDKKKLVKFFKDYVKPCEDIHNPLKCYTLQ